MFCIVIFFWFLANYMRIKPVIKLKHNIRVLVMPFYTHTMTRLIAAWMMHVFILAPIVSYLCVRTFLFGGILAVLFILYLSVTAWIPKFRKNIITLKRFFRMPIIIACQIATLFLYPLIYQNRIFVHFFHVYDGCFYRDPDLWVLETMLTWIISLEICGLAILSPVLLLYMFKHISSR